MTSTVAIEQDSINKVKAYIIGKGYSIGEFYALAASLVMQNAPFIIVDKSVTGIQDLTADKAIGKPFKPSSK